MKIIFILVIGLAVMSLVAGCGNMALGPSGGGTPTHDSGTIEGKVNNSALQPLSQASLTLEGSSSSVLTGSDGAYIIQNAPVGKYNIYASKTGFLTSFDAVTVSAGATVMKDFTLMPTEEAGVSFSVTSTSFAGGTNIPKQFTVDGSNESIGLQWKKIPIDTQSFAISMTDKDANNKSHLLFTNIDKSITFLDEAAYKGTIAQHMPLGGVTLPNDFGNVGYDGPGTGQPSGTKHTYEIRVWALSVPTTNWQRYSDFLADGGVTVKGVATIEGTYTKQ